MATAIEEMGVTVNAVSQNLDNSMRTFGQIDTFSQSLLQGGNKISQSMLEMSQMVENIHHAVSDIDANMASQTKSMADIAQNVHQTNDAIIQVTQNSQQMAKVAREVSPEVASVEQIARQTSSASDQVRLSAEGLTQIVHNLNNLLASYKK